MHHHGNQLDQIEALYSPRLISFFPGSQRPTAYQRARAIVEVDVSFSEIIKFTNRCA
jgi:hypothetical protein